MPTFVILLGAPGAGKGTQAAYMSEKMGLAHISSGIIFRENIKNGTELGKQAQSYISRGELVPDDVTNQMIRERLRAADCAQGAILDGFPRTLAQAEALDQILAELGGQVDAVLYIKVSRETLIRRLSGRWLCKAQDHVYHEIANPPKKEGVCDIDGSELYQREDDRAETVAKRIDVYFEQTSPLIDHYRERGLLVEVLGEEDIEVVSQNMMAALPI
ncbi:MAG: adenylate kinase [Anaerolineales bacterium]|jgi:adenylate kinase